ncbi:hypothetical protein GALMADRAFT_257895 [Galerina marginata CBS 339.88]|uniref:Uncharacterized protein n=1 Tax=Galerina marginata (strain CBS 339.88) TaxID=685588 RepID=A0A067SCD6_GALM3|nr:hypothetical protein GALMADRAFT_257895 [Galerina marginata CBS 339.88]
MSSNIPPFKPRPPMIIPKGFFKSIRRFKIFPNHVRLPTTPAACARLRLKRKQLAETKRQTELITILKGRLEILSQQLSSLQDLHCAQLLFLQNLADRTTVKNNDPADELPHPSSIPFQTRTTLPLPTFALPQSYSSTPLPHSLPLPLPIPEPTYIHLSTCSPVAFSLHGF